MTVTRKTSFVVVQIVNYGGIHSTVISLVPSTDAVAAAIMTNWTLDLVRVSWTRENPTWIVVRMEKILWLCSVMLARNSVRMIDDNIMTAQLLHRCYCC